MNRESRFPVFASILFLILVTVLSGCMIQPNRQKARMTLFIGVDSSGSFYQSGYYENAMSFLAHYIHGHLHESGGLTKPRELFVGAIGGTSVGEPKAFHPIHDFQNKNVEDIQKALLEWFPATDSLTDFNAFFKQVARISKERNLTLSPITVLIISDGVPDTAPGNPGKGLTATYAAIDLQPMEYLSRNLTLRLAYTSPKVSGLWREHVARKRVRLWTADAEVMQGWVDQLQPQAALEEQDALWKWIKDNVDYRVRSSSI